MAVCSILAECRHTLVSSRSTLNCRLPILGFTDATSSGILMAHHWWPESCIKTHTSFGSPMRIWLCSPVPTSSMMEPTICTPSRAVAASPRITSVRLYSPRPASVPGSVESIASLAAVVSVAEQVTPFSLIPASE